MEEENKGVVLNVPTLGKEETHIIKKMSLNQAKDFKKLGIQCHVCSGYGHKQAQYANTLEKERKKGCECNIEWWWRYSNDNFVVSP